MPLYGFLLIPIVLLGGMGVVFAMINLIAMTKKMYFKLESWILLMTREIAPWKVRWDLHRMMCIYGQGWPDEDAAWWTTWGNTTLTVRTKNYFIIYAPRESGGDAVIVKPRHHHQEMVVYRFDRSGVPAEAGTAPIRKMLIEVASRATSKPILF